MRKLFVFLLALLLAVSCIPAFAETTEDVAKPTSVTIFHTNDIHGRYNSEQGMGYAMAASFINEARSAGENVLVFDAGDTLHGTTFATVTKGASIVALMNTMGYAAMSAGNHDFNYGKDHLLELSKEAAFPILSSNLLNEDGSYIFTPYIILEAGDKKIAVVGAQNPEIKTAIHPDHIAGIQFTGPEQVAKVVEEVKDQADAVIILCHWGADDAYDPNSSVLAEIPGVTLVIDAHSHTELPNIAQLPGNAPITSTGEYLNNLGKAVLTFEESGVAVTTELIPNPKRFEDHPIINEIQIIEADQAAVLDKVVGETSVELVGEREIVRTQESNWGDYACDIFLEVTEADVALMNGGNIRKTINPGPITVRDINEVYPFGNYVCVISLTGEQLKATLEHGFRLLPEQNGGFPQIGGMRVTVDPSKPEGERVTELMVKGIAYDPAKTYTMVTNDFLASGGDGYEMLASCPLLLQMSFMDEVITEHIMKQGTISPATDGRINILG